MIAIKYFSYQESIRFVSFTHHLSLRRVLAACRTDWMMLLINQSLGFELLVLMRRVLFVVCV